MVAQTFVSLYLYGYGTVLATIQKIFTTDRRRPRSTTRFCNGFDVYDYRRHGCSALPEVRVTAELHGGVYPHPVPFPVHHHDTHHYSTADGRAKRTG